MSASRSDKAKTQAQETNLSGVRVVVLDDSADNRFLIKQVLESMGAEVKEVESVSNALKLLQHFRPHIILSDISIPEEDGFSFIRKLRQLPREKGGEIPAIALTAYASLEDARKVLAAGFQAHLPKPIDILRLGSVVAEFAKEKPKHNLCL